MSAETRIRPLTTSVPGHTTPALARLAAAVVPPTAVAWLASRRGSLTADGAAAAAITGSVVGLAGGWRWSATLLTFFVSSTVLSHVKAQRKAALQAIWDKGARRDAGQVWANGGVAVLAALWRLWRPGPVSGAAFASALAAANADTWATELGVLQPGDPRLITTGRTVPRGTSGGVSLWGILAACAGSACIAAVAGLRPSAPAASVPQWRAVAIAGVCGSLADSVLGAVVQASYRCPVCQTSTERQTHTCGTTTVRVRGWSWCTNDVVNVAAIALAALIGAALTVRR